jgi:hypothetical protein
VAVATESSSEGVDVLCARGEEPGHWCVRIEETHRVHEHAATAIVRARKRASSSRDRRPAWAGLGDGMGDSRQRALPVQATNNRPSSANPALLAGFA